MSKRLSSNDAEVFDKNFAVFDPTDPLDLMLLNILGLANFFLLRGDSKITNLKQGNLIRGTFPNDHPLNGRKFLSLQIFDKTHKLTMFQAYVRNMSDILRLPIYDYSELRQLEDKENSGKIDASRNLTKSGFLLNLHDTCYMFFFIEQMLEHMHPQQVRIIRNVTCLYYLLFFLLIVYLLGAIIL